MRPLLSDSIEAAAAHVRELLDLFFFPLRICQVYARARQRQVPPRVADGCSAFEQLYEYALPWCGAGRFKSSLGGMFHQILGTGVSVGLGCNQEMPNEHLDVRRKGTIK